MRIIRELRKELKNLLIKVGLMKDEFKFAFSADSDLMSFYFLLHYTYCVRNNIKNMSFNDFIGKILSLFGIYLILFVTSEYKVELFEPRFDNYCADLLKELFEKNKKLEEMLGFSLEFQN